MVAQQMRLAYHQQMGPFTNTEEIQGARDLDVAVSRHTVVVEAIATVGADLAAATRLVATDLFHAFGSPEVRQIASDGTLRVGALGGDGELRTWADQRGIQLT